ncbi:MAG: glycoside hydrolase family 2 protein [Bacteroidales bacterium]|nr:glycoside hydrolase family 2 protein [Bacteroidales bacterium]
MLKSKHLWIIIIFIIRSSLYASGVNPYTIINLNDHWEFSSNAYNQSYPANIPGSIHTDLFQNQLISDPFQGQNENQLQWIDTMEWVYQRVFSKPKNLNPDDQIEIIFKGLDTYADIYLNDSLLLSTNNMFNPWKIKIKAPSLKKKNILKVLFKPTLKEEQKIYSQLPYKLPGQSRVVTRKAAYQYGWDWAPKYVSCGIWQDVELHIWNSAKISKLNYSIAELDSLRAIINFKIQIESKKDFHGDISIRATNENLNFQFDNISIRNDVYWYDFRLEIKNPKLWWTHNLGTPFLYDFEVQLSEKEEIKHSKKIQVGIRTIELIRDKDSFGESFYFKLNGVPIFMKGANYIPQSSFPGNVSTDNYKRIISDAKSANMNMLRLWGGGIYEKDIFYDLCDEAGILIWQDFMFANAMYLNDSLFLKNIRTEAEFQVQRLSKHPSVAVWCGNNEIDEAWHNWGWSNNYSKKDSTEIWNNYIDIFHNILPNIVQEVSPEIPYTSSSPLFGRGNPRSSFEGDNHYWYVWHDAYDFDWYNKVTGRFMSEFGFQSYPSIETIYLIDSSESVTINSKSIQAHQKHHKGNYLINHYMKNYYPVPDNTEDFIYVSQLLQAEGIRTGILAQRRAKPFCMGSLYWQLNDCWPAISWSSIDYSGNWKALHYYAKEDFKNIIANPIIENDSLKINIVSDKLSPEEIYLNFSLIDFYGQVKFKKEIKILLTPNSNQLVYKEAILNIIKDYSKNKHLLYFTIKNKNDNTLETRTLYLTEPKNLELGKHNVYFKLKSTKNGYELILKSSILIKNLFCQLPAKGEWSNNYFDLLPDVEKTIMFITDEKIKSIESKIKFKSLNHILNNK